MKFRRLYQIGDKMEDIVRGKLSHFPIIYAFVGGAGVIIFWRGIWHTMDLVMEYLSSGVFSKVINLEYMPWWDGVVSTFFGMTLLLLVGLFVSSFIGNEIIISGLRGEKKVLERAEMEMEQDVMLESEMHEEISDIALRLVRIQRILEKRADKK